MKARWFNPNFWMYLFKNNSGIKNIICRARGHGKVVWYNPNKLEPDMRCRICGEDLG